MQFSPAAARDLAAGLRDLGADYIVKAAFTGVGTVRRNAARQAELLLRSAIRWQRVADRADRLSA